MTQTSHRPKGFPIAWAKHLTGEEAKEFEKLVKNTTIVLGRLSAIIKEDLAAMEREEMSLSAFDKPNWELRQAYLLGVKNGLKKVDQLLP